MRKVIFIALSLLSIVGYGQGIKISALPQAGSLIGSELTPVVQNGITKKTTVQSIANLGGGSTIDTNGFWNIHGNSGTNPATNFIGTTDSVGLYIKARAKFDDIDQNNAINIDGECYGIASGINLVGYADSVGSGISIYGNSRQATALILAGTTSSPLPDIDIQPYNDKLKISLSSAGTGKVLTSDANGLASWQQLAITDTATLDFGNIIGNGHEVKTITVTGAALSDVVSLGIPNASMNDHASFVAWVSATDTVSVKCFNFDGSSFDPAAGLFKVKVFK